MISSKSLLEIWKSPNNQAGKATASSFTSLEASPHCSSLGGSGGCSGHCSRWKYCQNSSKSLQPAPKTPPFHEAVEFSGWIYPLPAQIHGGLGGSHELAPVSTFSFWLLVPSQEEPASTSQLQPKAKNEMPAERTAKSGMGSRGGGRREQQTQHLSCF